MAKKVWFNSRLPQTLQGVIFFSYLNAVFALLAILSGWASPLNLLLLVGALGAVGIANERRWGYFACAIVAVLFLFLQVVSFVFYGVSFSSMVTLIFSLFLLALIFNPASRSYQRKYFR